MSVKLLTEHNLEFLSLKGGRKGSSESIHFEIPHCWKSHVAAQMVYLYLELELSNFVWLYCRFIHHTKLVLALIDQSNHYVCMYGAFYIGNIRVSTVCLQNVLTKFK